MSLTPRIDRIDRNILINGNFDFWQRGVTASPVSFIYLADRWMNTTNVTSYSRQEGGPDDKSAYFARVSGTLGSVGLLQRVESTFARYIRNDLMTFSFWAKVGSGTVNLAASLREPSSTDTYTSTSLIYDVPMIVSTSWTKFVVTLPVNAAMRTKGFQIAISAPSVVTATTLDIAQVCLLDGDIADPVFSLAGNNHADELRLCQRYYEKTYGLNVNPGTITSLGAIQPLGGSATNGMMTQWFYKIQKMKSATITVYSPSTGVSGFIRGSTNTDLASNVQNSETSGCTIGTLQTNSVIWIQYQATADADIY